MSREEVTAFVRTIVHSLFAGQHPEGLLPDDNDDFEQFGLDSILFLELLVTINKRFPILNDHTSIFVSTPRFRTINGITDFLIVNFVSKDRDER